MKMFRAALVSTVVLLMTATACTTAPADPAQRDMELDEDTIVLDVRTPQEYADGHLEGAHMLDLTGGQLQAALPDLDPDAQYVVYCRSGNRSAQAVTIMEAAGFTDVTDLGSLQQAADATGIPIVS